MNGNIGDEKHSFRLSQEKLVHLAKLVVSFLLFLDKNNGKYKNSEKTFS